MRIIKKLSLKYKIVLITLLVSLSTVSIGFMILTYYTIQNYKIDLVNNGIMNAKLMGEYIIIPLTFQDNERGNQTMQTLKSIPNIITGHVYDENDRLFVSFNRSGDPFFPDYERRNELYYFEGNYLHLYQPIVFQTVRYGTIYLKLSTIDMQNRITRHYMTLLFIMVALAVLTLILSQVMQEVIAKPILALAKTTEYISQNEDYKIQLNNNRQDELGTLYAGFNNMLQQIVSRQDENEKSKIALLDSHQQLRGIIDAVPQIIYIKNIDDIILLANKKMAEIYQVPRNAIIGYTHSQLNQMNPDKMHPLSADTVRIINSQSTVLYPEISFISPEKQKLIFQITQMPFLYNGTNCVLGVAVDMTNVKEVELALRESKEQFTVFMDMMPAATFIKDNENRYLYVNQYLKNNFSADEWLTKKHVPLVNKSIDRIQEEDKLALKTPISLEEELIDKHGNKRQFETWKFPIKQIDKPTLIGGISIEITKKKRAELSIQYYIQELERNNKELAEFNYVASHDLREPLRTLTSYCELLREDIGNSLSDEAREDIAFIIDAAARMNTLIQDLLQLSRVGRVELKMEKVDIEDCIKVVLKDLKTKIQETNGEITWDKIPMIKGDFVQITRVLQNLIHNALKFTDKPISKIHIYARKTEQFVEIIVEDNGMGIDKIYLNQIFMPFKRLHARGTYEGTGIGLAIVKKIIERHNGNIWVESEINIGSKFIFTLKPWDNHRLLN